MATNASTSLVDAIANGSPLQALSSLYDTVEIRSNLTPPIVIGVSNVFANQNGTPNGGSSWVNALLDPTIILSGTAGVQTIGGKGADGTFPFMGILLGLVGVGFVLGRLSK